MAGWLRSIITGVIGLFVLVGFCSADERPNVVVILADDLGYADLGSYGGEIATPNLDGLAQGGLRFTQFYNTARCWPTRGSLLTGYYPQQIRRDTVPGVKSGGQGVRPAWAKLLPEYLRAVGYRNYYSGKWHVDGLPLKNGFDRSYNLVDQGRFFAPKSTSEDDQPLPAVERGSGYYSTIAVADHAIKCLRDHAEQHGDKPFFQYIAFTSPHFPLQALPEDIERYRHTYREGWGEIRAKRFARQKKLGIVNCELSKVEEDVGPPYDFPDAMKQLGPGEVNRPLPWNKLSLEQREFQSKKMSIHAAMVDRMDREIGRVLEQLRRMNAFENTLIFFLSDNGASAEIMVRDDGHDPAAPMGSAATHLCLGPGWSIAANTPFRRHKTWVHEGGISTPLIAHWPKGIAAKGELRHDPGHVIDIVPTVLELTKGQAGTNDGRPFSPPGKSLAPAFVRDGAVTHDFIWWLHEGNRAIRVGDWKLVEAKSDGKWELFNLKVDRSETQDLSGKHPERVKEMAAQWEARFEEYKALALRDPPPDAPAAKKKQQK